jgi:hypothetical protein
VSPKELPTSSSSSSPSSFRKAFFGVVFGFRGVRAFLVALPFASIVLALFQ